MKPLTNNGSLSANRQCFTALPLWTKQFRPEEIKELKKY
jgi:hypothetical protein